MSERVVKGIVKSYTNKAIKIGDSWYTITKKSLLDHEESLKESNLERLKGAYVEAHLTDHWIDNLIVLNPNNDSNPKKTEVLKSSNREKQNLSAVATLLALCRDWYIKEHGDGFELEEISKDALTFAKEVVRDISQFARAHNLNIEELLPLVECLINSHIEKDLIEELKQIIELL